MLKITNLFFFAIIAGAFLMASKSILLGSVYFFCLLPFYLILTVIRKRSGFVFGPVFMSVLFVYVFYYIRPVFLTLYPEYFSYKVPFSNDEDILIEALILQSGFSLAFVFVFSLVLSSYGKKDSAPNRLIDSKLFYIGDSYIRYLLVMTLIWVALSYYTGAGQKHVATWVNVILLVLPVSILLPCAVGYLSVDKFYGLSKKSRILIYVVILCNIAAIIYGGSKEGVYLTALCWLFMVVLLNGNFGVKFRSILVVGVGVVLAVVASVVLANASKYSRQADWSFIEVATILMRRNEFVIDMINQITSRFNGYDGVLVVLLSHPIGFELFANWGHISKSAIAQIVPGYQLDSYSLGVAVGVEFSGKEAYSGHAGALGLIGIVYFMHDYLGIVVMAIIALLFGGLMLWTLNKTKYAEIERTVMLTIIGYIMALWLSSGNLDRLMQVAVVSLAQVIFYYKLFAFFGRKKIQHLKKLNKGGYRGNTIRC